MKPARVPLIVLALLWSAFAGYVWLTAADLPERVATHFGAGGEPNGWMTRAGHVQFTLLFGLGVPAVVLAIFSVVRICRDRWLNIPHKAYWLAPERRQETFDFISRQGFWLAGLLIAFVTGIHHSILAANGRTPVALSTSEVGWIAGTFLVATFVWAAVFIGRFFRKPA